LSYIPAENQQDNEQPQPEKETSSERQKSYYDVIKEDDERLRADPEPQQQEREKNESQPDQQQSAGQEQTPEEPENANQPQTETEQEQQRREFVELNQAEETQAQRLFEHALQQRKMARLPGTPYGNMVDYCRQIIEKFPGSEYAWKARRMLGEVPRRYWSRYDITEDEIITGQN
jgi:outer membrane biosynthesis protein TonB